MRVLRLTAALLLLPRLVLACPVCIGQTDAPLARATTLGVAFMLGVVALVAGSVPAWRAARVDPALPLRTE